MEKNYFRVRNWEKYQSFNKDRPNWIKLHTSILDDYEYCQLPDTSKTLFVHLCIAAALLNNRIPNDIVWLRRKLSLRRIDLAGLLDAGFIEWCNDGNTDVTQPLHSRDREEKRRGEGERAREGTPPKILDGFKPTRKMIEEVKAKYGFSDSTIDLETQKFIKFRQKEGRYPADPETDWSLWMLRQWEFVGGPEQVKTNAKTLERFIQEEVDDAWHDLEVELSRTPGTPEYERAQAAIESRKKKQPVPDDEVLI